jgi:hypothetical protein
MISFTFEARYLKSHKSQGLTQKFPVNAAWGDSFQRGIIVIIVTSVESRR